MLTLNKRHKQIFVSFFFDFTFLNNFKWNKWRSRVTATNTICWVYCKLRFGRSLITVERKNLWVCHKQTNNLLLSLLEYGTEYLWSLNRLSVCWTSLCKIIYFFEITKFTNLFIFIYLFILIHFIFAFAKKIENIIKIFVSLV